MQRHSHHFRHLLESHQHPRQMRHHLRRHKVQTIRKKHPLQILDLQYLSRRRLYLDLFHRHRRQNHPFFLLHHLYNHHRQ